MHSLFSFLFYSKSNMYLYATSMISIVDMFTAVLLFSETNNTLHVICLFFEYDALHIEIQKFYTANTMDFKLCYTNVNNHSAVGFTCIIESLLLSKKIFLFYSSISLFLSLTFAVFYFSNTKNKT